MNAPDRSAQPVDVLRKLAFWAADTTQPEHETKERVAARAAVAELAEAVREERKAEAHAEARHEYTDAHEAQMAHWAARERTDAALARVQGGAA